MSSLKSPAVAIVTVTLVGLAAGAIGFSSGWFIKPAEVRTVQVEVPVEVPVQEDKDALATAQSQVSDLERNVAAKQLEVNTLEEKIRKGAIAGKALRAELAAVKAELVETEKALVVAIQEKEEVMEQLVKTTEMLEKTEVKLAKVTVQRDDAREDALFNRWQDFVKGSQLAICDRGGRKKLGNCREAVTASIKTAEREARFAHCLRSGQAQPTIRELEKGATLPEFAAMLDEEQRQTKGWYVDFCDPTLPENPNLRLAPGKLAKLEE